MREVWARGVETTSAAARAGMAALLASGLLLQGCGGGSVPTDPPNPGPAGVPADAWTLSGTVEFPAAETATQLKLVASSDPTRNDTSAFVSDPVPLTLSGTPPTATFSLAIDTAGTNASVSLMVWRDVDDDGMHDVLEPMRGMDPVPGSDVWCDADRCPPVAVFSHLTKGQSGYSSVDGSWSIATTGWYWDRGCGSHACAQLVVGSLSGARIGYWEYGTGAIVP